MQIGVVYPQMELGGNPRAVGRFGKAVEALGFDYLLITDHVLGAEQSNRTPPMVGPTDETDTFHDPLILFAYLSGVTEQIGFSTGVLVLPQRQTALVARQVADVDLLSNERVRLGVGVGWNPVEFDALGQNFTTRGARQEEQIALLRQLWTEPVVDFEGRFDRIDRAAISPKPNRLVPIWLGGSGEKAYDRAARLGDGFVFWGTVDINVAVAHWTDLCERVGALGRAVEDFGGEYASMSNRSNNLVAEFNAWREAGGTHFAFATMDFDLGDGVDAHIDYITQVASDLGLS